MCFFIKYRTSIYHFRETLAVLGFKDSIPLNANLSYGGGLCPHSIRIKNSGLGPDLRLWEVGRRFGFDCDRMTRGGYPVSNVAQIAYPQHRANKARWWRREF